jgi:hypothetical protein
MRAQVTAGKDGRYELRQAYTWRAEFFERHGRLADAQADWRAAERVPARDSTLPAVLVDLTPFYNAPLDESWLNDDPYGDGLRHLPHGRARLAGTEFDVRGLVQLAGRLPLKFFGQTPFPTNAAGIPVRQRCRRLHFLHATQGLETDGTAIGVFTIHYADGQVHDLPILLGRDVGTWMSDTLSLTNRPSPAWQIEEPRGITRRVFKTTWDNPRPDVPLETLDFASKLTRCGPFLIAITAEP